MRRAVASYFILGLELGLNIGLELGLEDFDTK